MTTTTPTTTQPAETTTTTPGTCTAEEFVEAFMVTGLVPVPNLYIRRGVQACAIGALAMHRRGEVPQGISYRDMCDYTGLHPQFVAGVQNGFDDRSEPNEDDFLYQQGYAVGQKVRALMGVTQ